MSSDSTKMVVQDTDFENAVKKVVCELPGIEQLYPTQLVLLRLLVKKENIFATSPTNSGKTLPALILPSLFIELNNLGYTEYTVEGKVLFVTALNSIQMSMISSARQMKLKCESVTEMNVEELMNSDTAVLFIGPEVLQISSVAKTLLKFRQKFILKVVDEAHLCNIVWLTFNTHILISLLRF